MFTCRCLNKPGISRSLHRSINVLRKELAAVALKASVCSDGIPYSSNKDLKRLPSFQNSRYLHTSTIPFADSEIIIKTPGFPESVTEGDVRWEKEVGDFVEQDGLIGEIETDKTALQVNAPEAGIIEELFAEDGARVERNDKLVRLRVTSEGAAPSSEKKVAGDPEAGFTPPPPPPPPPPKGEPPKVDVSGPAPTTAPTTPQLTTQKPMAVIHPTPPPPSPQMTGEIKEVKVAPRKISGTRSETKVKMNRMRQRIAQRLKEAQNTNAMLTTFNEIDMSNAIKIRNQYKDLFLKKHSLKLGFMSPFIKASSVALEQTPTVNAVIEDNYVIYRDFVDISVAVATPKGLVVPVLRDVHQMNFADIEKGLNDLGQKARDGLLAIEDMDGGTFTISNGGVFGSLMGTPIINPPQSAILGMHGIFERPVAINGKVEVRQMMYVALTYDHRLIDGREAVTFLRKIKQNIEDPAAMFLDL